MAKIVPTVTAQNAHTYREQVERVQGFAKRLHIDLMDGEFAPSVSVAPGRVWWPENTVADLHVMFQEPESVLKELVKLQPNLIIIPAESSYDIKRVLEVLRSGSVKLGLALLPETDVETVEDVIESIDHLLVFSGNLGYQGGSLANLGLLEKVGKAKALNPGLELGWDGGVNDSNIAALMAAGVDVINVGGYIHAAPDPEGAYNSLTTVR